MVISPPLVITRAEIAELIARARRAVAQPLSVSAQTPLTPIRRVSAGADPGALLDSVRSTSGLPHAIAIRTAMLGSSPALMQALGMDANQIAQRRSVLLNGIASAYPTLSEAGRLAAIIDTTSPIVQITGPEFEAFGDAMEGEGSAFVAGAFAGSGGIREKESPLLGVLKGASEPWARAMGRHLEDAFLFADRIRTLQEGG